MLIVLALSGSGDLLADSRRFFSVFIEQSHLSLGQAPWKEENGLSDRRPLYSDQWDRADGGFPVWMVQGGSFGQHLCYAGYNSGDLWPGIRAFLEKGCRGRKAHE